MYLCSPFGALAERLGTGLQNLGQRFDSARHLEKMPPTLMSEAFSINSGTFYIYFAVQYHFFCNSSRASFILDIMASEV